MEIKTSCRTNTTRYVAETPHIPHLLPAQASRRMRQILVWIVSASAGIGFLGNSPAESAPPTANEQELTRFQYSEVEMGVPFTLTFYAPNAEAANKAAQEVFARLKRLNAIYSDYDSESELSKLSRTSGRGQNVPVSLELWQVLLPAQRLAKKTGGAFDITVGPYVRLWRRARRNHKMPTSERLAEARAAVGYEHVKLDPQAQAVQLLRPGMRLDLGGIAKGEAVDEAISVLAQLGMPRALVDAGGDLAVGAAPPGREGWRIALAPLNPDEPPTMTLHLTHAAVATSGDATQFVEIDGKRYSHIVNPHTGLGLTLRSSVTVVAPSCRTADSLASAVSVLGPTAGLRFVNQLPKVQALIVTASAEGQQLTTASQGWRALLQSAKLHEQDESAGAVGSR